MSDLRRYINLINENKKTSLMYDLEPTLWNLDNHNDLSILRECDELISIFIESINLTKESMILNEADFNGQLNQKQLQNFFVKLVQAANAKQILGSLDDYDSTNDGSGELQQKIQQKMKSVFDKIFTKENQQINGIKSSNNTKWIDALKQQSEKLKDKLNQLGSKIPTGDEAKQMITNITEKAYNNPFFIPVALAGVSILLALVSIPGAIATGSIASGLGLMLKYLESDQAKELEQNSREILQEPRLQNEIKVITDPLKQNMAI